MLISLTILFFTIGFSTQSDPITIEHLASISVEEGYSYDLIHISDDRIVFQEFYTRDIVSISFNGSYSDTLNIPIGRGPGERSRNSSPMKANNEYLFVLDRPSSKVLKFSMSDFQFVQESITPAGSSYFVVNEHVYVRSMLSEKFYNVINFQDKTFTPLPASTWTESYHRLQHGFTFEAFDLATDNHLFMVKLYDPVYYIYDLLDDSLKLIRYEDNPATDFRNSDFMGNLRLHIQNAAAFGDGRLLGIHGNGRGSHGRVYRSNVIHFFEALTGKHMGQIDIPGVDIAMGSMITSDSLLAILDSSTHQIHIYRYSVNS